MAIRFLLFINSPSPFSQTIISLCGVQCHQRNWARSWPLLSLSLSLSLSHSNAYHPHHPHHHHPCPSNDASFAFYYYNSEVGVVVVVLSSAAHTNELPLLLLLWLFWMKPNEMKQTTVIEEKNCATALFIWWSKFVSELHNSSQLLPTNITFLLIFVLAFWVLIFFSLLYLMFGWAASQIK